MSEKRKPTYQEIIKLCNKKYKEIERLNKELQDTKEHLGEYLYEQEEENKRLNNIIENLTTMTVNGDRTQIKNTAQYKLEQAEEKIKKAIYFIELDMIGTALEELKGSDKE